MELGLKDKNCILEKGEQNEEMDDVSDMKWKWNLWTVDGGGRSITVMQWLQDLSTDGEAALISSNVLHLEECRCGPGQTGVRKRTKRQDNDSGVSHM